MVRLSGLLRRPWRLGGVVALVCLLHAWVVWCLGEAMVPLAPGGMKRIEAVYARQVQLAAAAPVAAVPAAPVTTAPAVPQRASVPTPAASGVPVPEPFDPASAPSQPVPPPSAGASDPMLPVESLQVAAPVEPPASAVLRSAVAASAVARAASSSPTSAPGPAFDWPLSTRIRYRLNGWYRGDIAGTAQVEWLRAGDRYQVHLDVDAGVVSRRMSSEGVISTAGLMPQRYEEVTKVVLVNPRVRRMQFHEQSVVLASGESVSRPGGPGDLQDTASQFIQMIYIFSTRPQLLQPGGQMPLQLALPHRVRPYVYEVGAQEWTEAPGGGWLETWPVRPRVLHDVPPAPSGKKDLSVEAWLAPRLQMLPVRIRIRQDADHYLDLRIDQLPEQAAEAVRR